MIWANMQEALTRALDVISSRWTPYGRATETEVLAMRAIRAALKDIPTYSPCWSPVFALAPNGYLWFALDCGHVVRGVKSGEHFNWSDDAENGDHECCDSAIAVAWMAIAIPDHPSANKCKRKTGLTGEPCGLTPPCPDCGMSCHDVAEGG